MILVNLDSRSIVIMTPFFGIFVGKRESDKHKDK